MNPEKQSGKTKIGRIKKACTSTDATLIQDVSQYSSNYQHHPCLVTWLFGHVAVWPLIGPWKTLLAILDISNFVNYILI